MSRPLWVLLHRWAGLSTALFLLVAGLTGSVIAFYGPLDAALNPQRHRVPISGPLLDPLVLYERAQAHATAQVRMDAMPLGFQPGEVVGFFAEAVDDPATGEPAENPLREVMLDPHTGELVRLRLQHSPLWPVTRENLLDVLYTLHYSLALPGRIGTWLFGIAAIVWTIDCFIGAWLTFPLRVARASAARSTSWFARWRPAWRVRWRGGSYKLNFDLHRAGGLWTWLMLLVLAWSSVGLNLGDEVYRPVMGALFDMRPPAGPRAPQANPAAAPALDFAAALARGRALAAAESARLGFVLRGESELTLDRAHRVYRYAFKSSADIGEYGGAVVLFDADTGAWRATALQDRQPPGPWLSDWLFALHFGAVWGLPMKVFICAMGLLVAMLSGTGVYLWWRKRRGRAPRAAAPRA